MSKTYVSPFKEYRIKIKSTIQGMTQHGQQYLQQVGQWIKFANGIFVTDDPVEYNFLDSHPNKGKDYFCQTDVTKRALDNAKSNLKTLEAQYERTLQAEFAIAKAKKQEETPMKQGIPPSKEASVKPTLKEEAGEICPFCKRPCKNMLGLTSHVRHGHPSEYASWKHSRDKKKHKGTERASSLRLA